jgi:hypothetical protein
LTDKLTAQAAFEAACKVYETGNFPEAISLFKSAALAGHPLAATNLGICFYFGDGVEQSYPMAMEHFLSASNEDLTTANYYIGIMKLNGQGVAADVEGALKCLETAATQGMAEAQYELGNLYNNGKPPLIRVDVRRAIHWFAYAAQQGHADANTAFEQLYYNGYETSGEPTGFWFEREASSGVKILAHEPFSVTVREGQYKVKSN